MSDQISSWDTVSEMGTRAVLLHPFNPIVCIADEKETIRYPLVIVFLICMDTKRPWTTWFALDGSLGHSRNRDAQNLGNPF